MSTTLIYWLNCRKSALDCVFLSRILMLMVSIKHYDYSSLLKYITSMWDKSCLDISIKCYPNLMMDISLNIEKLTAIALGNPSYMDFFIIFKNDLGKRFI